MASIINATTTNGLAVTPDNSGELRLQTNNGTTAVTIDTSQNVGIGTSTITSGAGWTPTLVLNATGAALVVKGVNGQENSFGNSNGLYIDCLGNSTATNNNIIFRNTASNSSYSALERMRITSSGHVGIGTSTPNIYSTSFARQFTASTTTASGYSVGTFAGGSGGSGGVEFGNQTVRQAGIYGLDGSALALYTNATNSGTGLTERMRITSAGRLAIGSSSTNYPLYVKLSSDSGDWFAKFENTQSSTPYGFYLQYPNAAPNGTASDFIYCADSAAARMTVRSNGGIANYSANDVNLSDEREKTNIQLAGSYLDKICAIPVKTFNYIDQNREEDDGLTLGVIAQDVQKVAPELVMESNWAAKDQPEKMRLSIYQTDLQYALMKCIQEQQAMIEELRAEVAALKSTLP